MTLSKDELQEAVKNTRKQARKELIKDGVIQVRCEPEVMNRLYTVADQQGMAFSVLVRTWLLERLVVEEKKDNLGGTTTQVTEVQLTLAALNRQIDQLTEQLKGA